MLNDKSKGDRLKKALALFIAKESAFEKFNQIKTNDYLFPDVVEKFTQKYQQEIKRAKQSAIDLQTELNLSPDEARQAVWLNALAMERQVYNKLDDEDFISQPVSNKLTLIMNLKMDAVGAGQIPPKFPPIKTWDIRLYSWLIKLFNGTWIQKVQADLTAAQYEYLTFIAYSHQQVSVRLRSLVADRGIFRTFVGDCAYYYEEIGKEVLDRAFATVQGSNSSAIAIQTKILSRIGQVAQHETVERLAESGAISQAVAINLPQRRD